RFIDWLMALPPELEQKFDEQLSRDEEELSMPYVTGIERRGIQKGLEQGLEQGREQGELREAQNALIDILGARFGSLPPNLVERVRAERNTTTLRNSRKVAFEVSTLDEFRARSPA
ncbi:MAG TPA: hypothetical protein VFJ58_18400, partial [Armatimonadota bacterium]|nr:hypothetical protein [Armatimonadota bacterium]